jgi:hypothetical protein
MQCYITSAVIVTSSNSIRIKLAPGRKPPVPTGYKAKWAPGSVWMLWRRGKYLVPAENRNPAVQPTDGAIPAPFQQVIIILKCHIGPVLEYLTLELYIKDV